MNLRVRGADEVEVLPSLSSSAPLHTFYQRRHERDLALLANAQRSGVVLSQILTQGLNTSPASPAARALAQRISGQGETFSVAFHGLSSVDQESLRNALGSQSLEQVLSLSQESDPHFFQSSLLNFGRSQEGEERLALAASCYRAIVEASPDSELRAQAQARLDLFQGGGSFGDQFEFYGQQSIQQSFNPALLIGMGLAGATFQTVRLASLSRFMASSGILSRGFLPQAVSWGLAFGAETSVFTFGTRGLNEAFGVHQDWRSEALGRDFLTAGFTLFTLKTMGGMSQSALSSLRSAEGISPWYVRATEVALPQAAMFTGILGMHAAEAHFGLRDPSTTGSMVAQSLATLFQFHISGRIVEGLGGGEYARRMAVVEKLLTPPPGYSGRPLMERLFPGRPNFVLSAMTPDGLKIPGLFAASVSEVDRGSHRPSYPPTGAGDRCDRPTGNPELLRTEYQSIRDELENLDRSLAFLASKNQAHETWFDLFHRVSRGMRELMSRATEATLVHEPHSDRLHFLQDIIAELRLIHRFTDRKNIIDQTGTRFIPSVASNEVQRALAYFYKTSSALRNFLDGSLGPVDALNHLHYARIWTQRALNIAFDGQTMASHEIPDFPYLRVENGQKLILPKGNFTVAVLGDEQGARSIELAGLGHEVIHINSDRRFLEYTRRRIQRAAREAQEKGEPTQEPKVHFVHGDWFATSTEADLVEAFYPPNLPDLPARSSPERAGAISSFLQRGILSKLAPRGTGFIISDRDDIIEDLAQIVRENPELDLLELQRGQIRPPLEGGKNAGTPKDDDNNFDLVSWMMFRRRN